MIQILIGIALKSLIIAGLALGLLAMMRKRSAAERSWVAHIGLLALVVLAIAPLALPRWPVEAPALLAPAPEQPSRTLPTVAAPKGHIAAPTHAAAPTAAPIRLSPTAAATIAYALPAALLLFITFMALFRLVALRARADVLVDGHWLSALARAQRRMGFKHGTALLTSNDLSSPISWGLMRPVILLNARAVEASGEAEAIIAHELAHVARMDWLKLLLARLATALFWFNPLVWVLAREAHQLREEAADDSVLAADIPETDYAQLLVGVARHECPGLLLGAHGVAPSKSSLARRVARVLDGKSVRGPVARSFAWGVLAGAVVVAAPLAALTITPASTKAAAATPGRSAVAGADGRLGGLHFADASEAPGDLPTIIASGVSTAVAAVVPAKPEAASDERIAAVAQTVAGAKEMRATALAAAGDAVAKAQAVLHDDDSRHDSRIDRIIEMRAVGVTPDYVNAMRAAAPRLRSLDPAHFTGLKAVGVTPEYARGLASAGFTNLGEDELTSARAVGLSPDYARALASAGLPLDIENYIEMRAVGVPADYIASLRRSGIRVSDPEKIVEMWAVGVRPGDLDAPPTPPRPPRRDPGDE